MSCLTDSFQFRRQRAADATLDDLHFEHLRTRAGQSPVPMFQMHYARKGHSHTEMEFVAIREGCDWEAASRGRCGNSIPASASAPAFRRRLPRIRAQ